MNECIVDIKECHVIKENEKLKTELKNLLDWLETLKEPIKKLNDEINEED